MALGSAAVFLHKLGCRKRSQKCANLAIAWRSERRIDWLRRRGWGEPWRRLVKLEPPCVKRENGPTRQEQAQSAERSEKVGWWIGEWPPIACLVRIRSTRSQSVSRCPRAATAASHTDVRARAESAHIRHSEQQPPVALARALAPPAAPRWRTWTWRCRRCPTTRTCSTSRRSSCTRTRACGWSKTGRMDFTTSASTWSSFSAASTTCRVGRASSSGACSSCGTPRSRVSASSAPAAPCPSFYTPSKTTVSTTPCVYPGEIILYTNSLDFSAPAPRRHAPRNRGACWLPLFARQSPAGPLPPPRRRMLKINIFISHVHNFLVF